MGSPYFLLLRAHHAQLKGVYEDIEYPWKRVLSENNLSLLCNNWASLSVLVAEKGREKLN